MRLVAREDTPGQWAKATTAYEKLMAKGSTLAMRKIGKLAVKKGRAAIGSAGFTANVQRTLQAINKPKSGFVLNPSVYIHSTVNYLDVFEKGKTINSEWLWLPMPSVPPNRGAGVKFGGLISRPHMTPRQYIAKIGPLIKIERIGKPPVLAAVIRGGKEGGKVTRGRLRKGRSVVTGARGEERIVVLFVAISSITIRKKFDTKRAIEDAAQDIGKEYNELVEPYEGRR